MRWFLGLLFLLLLVVAGHAQSTVGGRTSPDGTEEIRCDLPAKMHIRNTGGTDGLGLCVWASLSMSGEWAGDNDLSQLFDRMRKEPGGGWPQKVDAMMKRYSPKTQYLQSTGGKVDVLRNLLDSGRIACITYGFSPRYRGGIDHMVCCVHLSDRWAAVLDNNYPGDDKYEWMKPAELFKRWNARSGGWLIGLGAPPPPPIPTRKTRPVVIGQCSGGSCPLPFSPLVYPVSDSYPRWVEVSPGSGVYDVWEGGVYVGRRTLRSSPTPSPASNSTPARPTPASNAPTPAGPETEALAEMPTGVVADKVKGYGDSWCGKPLGTGEIGAGPAPLGGIPDDRRWPYLSVIAPDSVRRSIADRILSDDELRPLLGKVKVRSFSVDDPFVRDVGLSDGTGTTLVFQGPEQEDGKAEVRHRQRDFDGGPAVVAQAIRKADPGYAPSTDPDLRKPDAKPKVEGADPWYLSPLLWAVLSGLLSGMGLPVGGKLLSLLRGILSGGNSGQQLAALVAEMQQLRQDVNAAKGAQQKTPATQPAA